MKFLLDTHILLWLSTSSHRIPEETRQLLAHSDNELVFSAASIWEVAIKAGMGRDDFKVDPRWLRRSYLDNGYIELPILGEHAVAVVGLPPLHKDPFDRLLIAQATVEGILLLTGDPLVAQYPGPIRKL
ncbi:MULTISPECIES: type II toxin-antitoxin system VapC family toxin [Asticcacaulis]|uniref:type II toxin-antitoxin system VapC family toxin n=1 Tax=Asticcacaulis TaxID=76890 RepID=UPI001AE904FA|nr:MULTISPECIES: type II toxin-antitoxin system VapC family toxin [Asticcacaulis]MBP2160617.1 PIN domain nuclease of toxin-antitoxin system [Asticcacaulis solisilvae]MDR6801662.1 PIN domain nuclease of toxin-antitoxin system [Asticcacaulis sp. BE141]